jgi:hypothetical protein
MRRPIKVKRETISIALLWIVSLCALGLAWLAYRINPMIPNAKKERGDYEHDKQKEGFFNISSDQGGRMVDEIAMQKGLNTTGDKILGQRGSTQCRVAGVPVPEMEINTTADPQIISCTVPKTLLKPIRRRDPGSASSDVGHLLLRGPVIAAFCRPSSTLCTVEFRKNSSATDMHAYTEHLTHTFGFSSQDLSDITSSGTMYTMMPSSATTSAPKRTTVRVSPDGDRRVLVYKYCARVSTENPLDLWRSAGRNQDDDIALDDNNPTNNYCSDMLGEAAWEAFAFTHVLLEVRRGPDVMSAFRFRATKDRMSWFHPKNLVSARFGPDMKSSPLGFSSKPFSRFSMQDIDGDHLYWAIVDELKVSSAADVPGSSRPECTTKSVYYLAAPYRATACELHERLNGRIVTAVSPDPIALNLDNHTATHMLVWLVTASNDTSGKRDDAGAYTPDAPIAAFPGMMEQRKPTSAFENAPARPTKDRLCVLASYSNGGVCAAAAAQRTSEHKWNAGLPEMKAYTQDALVQRMDATRRPMMATLSGDSPRPALSSVNLVRFHKSCRVVMFGDGRDFSPDAEFVAVLQDNNVMASYGYAQAARAVSTSVRYSDGRVAQLLLAQQEDNDGSFIDACLAGADLEGAARSIIVEKLTLVPLEASRKCNQGFGTVHETLLHVGNYHGTAKITDIMGNTCEVPSLRSFRVGEGYTAILFPQPKFKGTPLGSHKGPAGVCLTDAQTVRSIRVMVTAQ